VRKINFSREKEFHPRRKRRQRGSRLRAIRYEEGSRNPPWDLAQAGLSELVVRAWLTCILGYT
jgi:hypothetical protein